MTRSLTHPMYGLSNVCMVLLNALSMYSFRIFCTGHWRVGHHHHKYWLITTIIMRTWFMCVCVDCMEITIEEMDRGEREREKKKIDMEILRIITNSPDWTGHMHDMTNRLHNESSEKHVWVSVYTWVCMMKRMGYVTYHSVCCYYIFDIVRSKTNKSSIQDTTTYSEWYDGTNAILLWIKSEMEWYET